MKTSYYFSNRIREHGLNLVAVSNSYPRHLPWLKEARQYRKLCPGWSLVKGYKKHNISWPNYLEIYHEDILDKLDPETVYSDLGDNAIILCWEKPGKLCHRRLIADWLYDHLRIRVNEL
ncbi:MAG: hypothetical protein CVU43_05585 [Chloroflexi bacterium HGW-Chloroflexi-5]|jgi:hypothetical protein|nr:MAG: hypothetical protein CVU43_05585 [Chloroflexi bacterium HGW-Chloroflexi-5]